MWASLEMQQLGCKYNGLEEGMQFLHFGDLNTGHAIAGIICLLGILESFIQMVMNLTSFSCSIIYLFWVELFCRHIEIYWFSNTSLDASKGALKRKGGK